MQYRTLGRTGVRGSTLVLGAMNFGSIGRTTQDEVSANVEARSATTEAARAVGWSPSPTTACAGSASTTSTSSAPHHRATALPAGRC